MIKMLDRSAWFAWLLSVGLLGCSETHRDPVDVSNQAGAGGSRATSNDNIQSGEAGRTASTMPAAPRSNGAGAVSAAIPPAGGPKSDIAGAPASLPSVNVTNPAKDEDAGTAPAADGGKLVERPALCDEAPGDVVRPATQADFIAWLVGDWYACSGPLFCDAAPRAGSGLRFDENGTWTRLGPAKPTDPGQGPWEVIDTIEISGATVYQLNIKSFQGTYITQPVLSAEASHMHIGGLSGSCFGDYVKLGVAREPIEAKKLGAVSVEATTGKYRTDESQCDSVASRVRAVPSHATVLNQLPGVWGLCGSETPFWMSSERGLELDKNGRWNKLYADDERVLWRAIDLGERGTWEVLEDTGQLNLSTEGLGTNICSAPWISEDGSAMVVNSSGGQTGRYVRLKEQP